MSLQSSHFLAPAMHGLFLRSRGLMIFISLVAVAAATPSQPANDELAWIEDIVLRPDFVLQASESGTRRWSTAPKLAVMGGAKDQQKVVADVVEHLNETLRQTPLKGITTLKPNDPTATLPVYFVRKSDIPATAAKLGVPPNVVQLMSKEKWNYCRWSRPNPANKFELRRGFVIVSSDKADADHLRNNLLGALSFELGLMDYSKRDGASVFYKDNDVKKLTAKDQQLIIWYYNHVPAGSTTVKKLYEDHWPKAKAPSS